VLLAFRRSTKNDEKADVAKLEPVQEEGVLINMSDKPSRFASSLIIACGAALALGATATAAAEPSQPIKIDYDDPALEWGGCPEGFPEGCGLAVLQGDPARPNADVFLRLSPDTGLAHHWHTSAERMVLVSGEFHVDFDDHPPVVMRAGSYAYGPAKLPHHAHCAAGDPCVLFIAFEEPVDTIFTGHEH
jgi:mannose-6-phosphate isomerase-like protein (cupin superfamily)